MGLGKGVGGGIFTVVGNNLQFSECLFGLIIDMKDHHYISIALFHGHFASRAA